MPFIAIAPAPQYRPAVGTHAPLHSGDDAPVVLPKRPSGHITAADDPVAPTKKPTAAGVQVVAPLALKEY